jgi:intracellular septation protein
MNKRLPPYFLLSFIPALAYWLLETYSSLEVALAGGIGLGIIEMIFEKKFTGHVHSLSRLNVGLIVVLGMISLIAKEGIWFKLQPTFTGLSLSGVLFYKKIKGRSLLVDLLSDFKQYPPLPANAYKMMEWHLALFMVCFSVFMVQVAFYQSTATWLFWKTGGFYLAFTTFMVVEVVYLRWHLRRKI